ncbi:MAG: DUF6263 family protein [Candidatus Omnitrophica bacterium]|nr:DUF6263 family protein [Candidatus Omnitrophota bacterium]
MKRILFFYFIILCLNFFAQEESVKKETEIVKEEMPKEYDLRYIYNKGDVISYSLKVENRERLKVSGMDMGEKIRKTIINFSQKVEDVDENGNGIIKWKYLSGSYNDIKVDLGEKEATIKMNSKGEILESRGLEEMSLEFFKIIQKSISDYIPGFDRLPIKIDFSKFDSNEFNAYWESFRPVFPDRKLKIGDTWEKETILPMIFKKGRIIYTLKNFEENKAYISLSIGRRDIKVSGEIIFDIEKGKLIDQEFIIKAENIKEKVDFGQFTQYKEIGSYEISGTIITKVKLKEI